MSIQAAKEELNALTEFQRDIHVTDIETEPIISNFYRAFIKSTWYSSLPMKLKSSTDGDEIIYTVNNSFHFLIYSYMRFMTPPIKVKDSYKGRARIAWCHNLGTNITKQATFKEDDDTYQKWDNIWADMYFQFFQNAGAGKRENHNIGIGNVKCMEEWSNFLPSYPINVDQPWFYSMDTALAFPIFYKNSQTRAEHRYTFRRKIGDLLRVQILGKDHKWKNITRGYSKYIDTNPLSTIKLPELWGRYAYVTDNELTWYRCVQPRVFFTRDVEICDTQNPSKFKSTAEISLHCTTPCLAFFWASENMNSTNNHNYSNYTTNVNDLYSGWDPIKTTTLKYGTSVRLDNMPSDHFSIAEARKHFPSSPSERGYHGYSFANDSTSYYGDIGLVFASMNAKLYCRIANNDLFATDLYEEEEEEEEYDDIIDPLNVNNNDDGSGKISIKSEDLGQSDQSISSVEEITPSFLTRVRLLVVRKFTIHTQGENGYRFTIE